MPFCGLRIRRAWLIAVVAVGVQQMSVVGAQQAMHSESRKVKERVSPVYPELARKLNIHGKVKLEATVGPDGKVRSVRVLGGHPLLVTAAQDAMNKWKFEAAPTETTQVVEFEFTPAS